MPTNQLQERLDSMLDWLVEERFIRRLGVDESYEARRQDEAIDEEETWDDDVPVWVNVAQESGGVTLQEQRQVKPAPSSWHAFSRLRLRFIVEQCWRVE